MADRILGKDLRLDDHQHLKDQIQLLKDQNAVLRREKEVID